MKRFVMALAVCGAALAHADATNYFSEVRSAIGLLEGRLTREQKNVGVILDWGLPFATNAEYVALSHCVSNDWQRVLDNLDSCATNRLERLMVLGVRDRFGADFYLDFLDKMVDLKARGAVSQDEWDWVRHTEVPELEFYLVRKFTVPKVRSLVVRIQSVAGNSSSNYWNDVLSGVAYTNYLDEVEAGMWGENPPR